MLEYQKSFRTIHINYGDEISVYNSKETPEYFSTFC